MKTLKTLLIGLDRGEWLEVEGVVDVRLRTGTYVLGDGSHKTGIQAEIVLDFVKFDDGQAALDAALSKRGSLRACIPGQAKVLVCDLAPYESKGSAGKQFVVKAIVDNPTWRAKQ